MTLTEYLSSNSRVLEVDIEKLPEGMNVEQFVQLVVGFEVVEQNVPPIVIKDSRKNREIIKKEYDQS